MTENNNTKDPDTGLTEEEVIAVENSWSMLYRKERRKESGVKLFVRLFTLYPSAIEMFPQFRGSSLEEVGKHPKLPAHAMSVMYALASYVDNLEDAELLVELVKKTSISHIERGVSSREFKWLTEVVPAWLDETLEDECTALMKSSWVKLLNVVVAVMSGEEQNMKS
ncbi:globin-like [Ostrea edulis]|uniref:globin-like n=1 Tax=Ostrea edulis TaxID=37623 RepID=UPI002094E65C|nr:globin-like [Ostrea edulis]XP_048741757.1 globin-like [Ostrea edulis]XP_048741758.1 globin-like [Ostrea edulis]XP_048741759.1 globin-like [Ostrea edulis]